MKMDILEPALPEMILLEFIHQWAYSPLLGPVRLLSFVILYTFGRISPS
jgi:hypothetical protein